MASLPQAWCPVCGLPMHVQNSTCRCPSCGMVCYLVAPPTEPKQELVQCNKIVQRCPKGCCHREPHIYNEGCEDRCPTHCYARPGDPPRCHPVAPPLHIHVQEGCLPPHLRRPQSREDRLAELRETVRAKLAARRQAREGQD